MPNKVRRSKDSVVIGKGGRGRHGFIAVTVTLNPAIKDALIDLSEKNRTSIMAEIREAIDKHLEAA